MERHREMSRRRRSGGGGGDGRRRQEEEDLHTLARNGDVVGVEIMVSSNPLRVNSRDKHSRTPLHLAAWAGHADVVNCLCKHKADVGAAAMDDMGAIHFAAQKGHLEVVRTLVAHGVSVKATNRKGMTALHYAAQGSYVDLAKYLVKKGANREAKTKAGKTPIELATNEEMCTFLQSQGSGSGGGEGSAEEVAEKDNGAVDEANAEVKESKGDAHPAERLKRKYDMDEAKKSSPEPKRPKVILSHLLDSDDSQENDDDQ
ncbi:hypothetical protein Drorol1_Dr00014555 [Drosera rotundifolia]